MYVFASGCECPPTHINIRALHQPECAQCVCPACEHVLEKGNSRRSPLPCKLHTQHKTHTYTHRCTASCQPSESASACLFSLMEVRCGGGTVVSRVGQNHSFIGIHSVYTVSFGRDHLTIHTVIYGVYIRFWPALGMRVSRWASRIIQIMPYSTTLCLQYSVKYEEWGSNVFNSNLAEWGSNVNSNLVESCPTLQSSN